MTDTHDTGGVTVGPGWDRALADLALSVNSAVRWEFHYADDAVTWAPEMGAMLGMPDATESDLRLTFTELIRPMIEQARSAAPGEDVECEHRSGIPGERKLIRFRAQRFGRGRQGGLIGIAIDATTSQSDRQALADLADRYRLLVELSPDAICVHQDGYVRYVNSATITVLRADSDSQILGKRITDFVAAHSVPEVQGRIASLTVPGASSTPSEVTLRGFDGSTSVVEAVSVRTTWEGKPAYQVIMRDVTSQRAAASALHYQAALVQHVSDAIIATDDDGMVTSWNPAAETVYGVRFEQAIGRQVGELVGSPLDPGALHASGGAAEVAHRRADGTELFIRASSARMSDGYVLVCSDDTARRRAEQHYSTVVAALDEGVVVIDANGVIESANPAAENILGMKEPDLIGLPPVNWPMYEESGRRIPAAEYAATRTRLTGEIHNGQIGRIMQPNEDSVWVSFTTRPLMRESRPPYSLVTSLIDITERHRNTEALRYQATHDDLTGLLNRKGLYNLLDELVQEGVEQLGVLFCDIDNFKRVNDSIGHSAGDELLVVLAQRLSEGLPGGCTAARLSGDEFLVICPDLSIVGGLEALTRWVSDFLRMVVPVNNQLISVSASVGAALLDPSMTSGDMLRYADMAMFNAKSRGPGQIAMANPALVTSVEGQLPLEEQLRSAISDDGLRLHYQPMVSREGSVVMAEALVRWPHPDRGLLTPNKILPVAEKGNLLRELDQWVIRTAMRDAANWPRSDGKPVSVAINLGSLLPDDPNFVDEVTEVIAESGISWNQVVLEMVETALVDLPNRSLQGMVELIERDVRFAVDDFGTGRSSLARLKDIPAQIIKLDRRFVAHVDVDPADLAIAKALVDMTRAMGRTCVAEGVETASQFHALDELGIDFYQGWLFSYPVPNEKLRKILRAGKSGEDNNLA